MSEIIGLEVKRSRQVEIYKSGDELSLSYLTGMLGVSSTTIKEIATRLEILHDGTPKYQNAPIPRVCKVASLGKLIEELGKKEKPPTKKNPERSLYYPWLNVEGQTGDISIRPDPESAAWDVEEVIIKRR